MHSLEMVGKKMQCCSTARMLQYCNILFLQYASTAVLQHSFAISVLVRALCSRRLKQPHTMQVTEDDDPESRGRLAPHELPYGMGCVFVACRRLRRVRAEQAVDDASGAVAWPGRSARAAALLAPLKQPHTMQVTEDDDPESRGRLAPHELPYGMGAGVERAMEPVERRTDDALDTLASKRSFSSSFSGSVFGVAYLFLVLQRHLCELLLTAGRLRNEVSRQAVSSRRRRFVAGFTRI